MSHTLLSLIDPETGQPLTDTTRRLGVFTKMFHSGIPPNFDWMTKLQLYKKPTHARNKDEKDASGIIRLVM